VTSLAGADALRAHVDGAIAERVAVSQHFFGAEADRIASLCHAMAERFARGGRLIAVGLSEAARSDVHHVAVEFVHPVIVGKRALPALGVVATPATLAGRLKLLAGPDDMVIAFGEPDENGLAAAVAAGRASGALTVAFAPLAAEWEFDPPTPDPLIRQELVETLYHVLWELVHVFFEHRGLLQGRTERRSLDVGASSFLYPFLADREDDLDAVLADVRASVVMKADEAAELRVATIRGGLEPLRAAAATMHAAFAAGGTVLALGNGGSATDAMDVVADLTAPPPATGWRPRRALDLTADPAILTAIANDIGTDAMFSRQVIAYGGPQDVLLALSTSGDSRSVVSALAEARRRGLRTIALVGYDGGRIAAERMADHVVLTSSQHIPRIQEAQVTAYHLLCDLVDRTDREPEAS
jgi:D-sedoheptulose 7-phosphate isomerase